MKKKLPVLDRRDPERIATRNGPAPGSVVLGRPERPGPASLSDEDLRR